MPYPQTNTPQADTGTNFEGRLKETDDFQQVIFLHLIRIGQYCADQEAYKSYIEAFDDYLDPYKDERCIDEINDYEKELMSRQKEAITSLGQRDQRSVSQAELVYCRKKFRSLLRLALRKRFIPAGEVEVDVL